MRALVFIFTLLLANCSQAQLLNYPDSSSIKYAFGLEKGADKNLWTKPFIGIREKDTWFNINPYFYLEGQSNSGENFYRNSRGFIISGRHKNFRFLSALQETQFQAPAYEFEQAKNAIALRGSNRYKLNDSLFDYADFMGGLQYVGDRFFVELSNSPIQIGQGIRSPIIDGHNHGFSHLSASYFNKSKKLEINYGVGLLFQNSRVNSSAIQNSELPIARDRFSWTSLYYHIYQGFKIHFYTEFISPSSQQEPASAALSKKLYRQWTTSLPLTGLFSGLMRKGLEIQFSRKHFNLYASYLSNSSLSLGGHYTLKGQRWQSFIALQYLKQDPLNNNKNLVLPSQFGQYFNQVWSNTQQEFLTEWQVNFKKFSFIQQVNFAQLESNSQNSNSKWVVSRTEFGYLVHPNSHLHLALFADIRENDHGKNTYFGVRIYNKLGIKDRSY